MVLIIKLSGEGLSGDGEKFSQKMLKGISDQISTLLNDGHKIALVIGGGNIFRGKDLVGKLAVEDTTADYVGMLGTVQNALVVRDYFKSQNIDVRIMSAISMPQVCEGYIPKRALRHMEKGRIVIFAGGLGVPFFTTDSASVQRALEMHASLLIMAKSGVDGIYSADPDQDPSAKKIDSISCSEVLDKQLKVADLAAIALARDNKLQIKIVAIDKIQEALKEDVGSSINPN